MDFSGSVLAACYSDFFSRDLICHFFFDGMALYSIKIHIDGLFGDLFLTLKELPVDRWLFAKFLYT